MRGRFEAVLNGVSFSSIAPEATILDIQKKPADIENTKFQKGTGRESIRTGKTYGESTVTIYYDLSIYDTRRRQNIMLDIQRWAMKGGVLEISDMQGKYINVHCLTNPSASGLRWTDQLSIVFVADEIPFWLEQLPNTLTISGLTSMTVSGGADYAPVSAVIRGNQTITNVTVTCGDTSMTISGVNVPTSDSIVIDYDENEFLTIKTGSGTDLMAYRTGSDELLLPCGATTHVNVSGNTTIFCTLRARGRWL